MSKQLIEVPGNRDLLIASMREANKRLAAIDARLEALDVVHHEMHDALTQLLAAINTHAARIEKLEQTA